jgi:hypothetical protein
MLSTLRASVSTGTTIIEDHSFLILSEDFIARRFAGNSPRYTPSADILAVARHRQSAYSANILEILEQPLTKSRI